MASSQTFCVFCKIKKGKLNLFTQDTLNKCTDILKIRKEHNLKFQNVNFPSVLSDIEGYHVKCYRNFMALISKYKLTSTAIESSSSTIPLLEPSTSTSGKSSQHNHFL